MDPQNSQALQMITDMKDVMKVENSEVRVDKLRMRRLHRQDLARYFQQNLILKCV